MEERPLPDVSPDHLLGLVPGLVHDLALVLPSFCGRGGEAGAQRVPAERIGREAGVADMTLDDQSDAGIGQPAIEDLAVLLDRPEDRAGGDLRIVESCPQDCDGTGGALAALGYADLDAISGLICLRPAQGQDDSLGSPANIFDIEVDQLRAPQRPAESNHQQRPVAMLDRLALA